MCFPQNYLTLLDDEDHTLESLKIQDEQHLVIEGLPVTHTVTIIVITVTNHLLIKALSPVNLHGSDSNVANLA